LTELLAYLWDEMPADHPFARLSALPGMPESREVDAELARFAEGCWRGPSVLPVPGSCWPR